MEQTCSANAGQSQKLLRISNPVEMAQDDFEVYETRQNKNNATRRP